MASTQPSTSSPTLYFESQNPSASTTILLVHGGFSSHREYTFVAPQLSTYHLLIPDLPAHGRFSSAQIPYCLSTAAALLADLISKHAKNQRAHVVGVSLGGYTSLYLAAKYPDLVTSVFVTGCGRLLQNERLGVGATSLLLGVWFPTIFLPIVWLPPDWYRWMYQRLGLTVPDGLQDDQRNVVGYGLGRQLGTALGYEFSGETVDKVGARTLLIAAELNDDLVQTKAMGEMLRKVNGESRAAKALGMRHIWDLQDWALFATAISAWVEEEGLPAELEIF